MFTEYSIKNITLVNIKIDTNILLFKKVFTIQFNTVNLKINLTILYLKRVKYSIFEFFGYLVALSHEDIIFISSTNELVALLEG